MKKGGFSIALAPLVTGSTTLQREHAQPVRTAGAPTILLYVETPGSAEGWPGFLIHDSHIFDGVNGRQIALRFKLRAGA